MPIKSLHLTFAEVSFISYFRLEYGWRRERREEEILSPLWVFLLLSRLAQEKVGWSASKGPFPSPFSASAREECEKGRRLASMRRGALAMRIAEYGPLPRQLLFVQKEMKCIFCFSEFFEMFNEHF